MFTRTDSGIKNDYLFYNKRYEIIVEGKYDCIFWKDFFPEIDGYKPKFKNVGGKNEVQKYLEILISSDAHYIVALDSDYNFLKGISYRSNRVIETQVHSIENLMFCPSNIVRLIQNLSKITDYDISQVEMWMQHFDEKVYSLMVADYIIECALSDKKKCMGDNCELFLINNSIAKFSEDKINNFITSLGLSEQDLAINREKLKTYKPRLHARGHFFFSAVYRFIINETKKISDEKAPISIDSLYSMSIESHHRCFKENPILIMLKEQANIMACEFVEILKTL